MRNIIIFAACASLAFGCSKHGGAGDMREILLRGELPTERLEEMGDRFSKIALALRLKDAGEHIRASALARESLGEGCAYAAIVLASWEPEKAKEHLERAAKFDSDYSDAVKAALAYANLGRLADPDSIDEKTAQDNIGILEACASRGCQSAAFHLRTLYSGKSRYADPAKAHRCNAVLSKLSSQGWIYEYEYALDFFKGRGTEKDEKRAAEMFAKLYAPLEHPKGSSGSPGGASFLNSRASTAAKAGACLAYALERGIGVKKDAEGARKIREKIAATGDPTCLHAATEVFSIAFGAEPELADGEREESFYSARAEKLESERAANAEREAEAFSREISKLRKINAKELSGMSAPNARVAYAEKLMAIEKAASGGGECAIIFYDAKNFPKGLEILKAEAKCGNPLASLRLADLYLDGKDGLNTLNAPVGFDEALAKKHLHDALKNGGGYFASEAFLRLGRIAEGIRRRPGEPLEDENAAVKFYTKSAKLGNICAIRKLADLYGSLWSGFSKPDKAVSLYWAETGAGRDHRLAYDTACEYMKGKIFPRDAEKAARYYLKSAELANALEAEADGESPAAQTRFITLEKTQALESYARICELGLLAGKSQKDADKIREKFDTGNIDVSEALLSVYRTVHFRNDAKMRKYSALLATAEEAHSTLAAREPPPPSKALGIIARLKELPNLESGEIQYALAHLHMDAAAYYRRQHAPEGYSAPLEEAAFKHFEKASSLGVARADIHAANMLACRMKNAGSEPEKEALKAEVMERFRKILSSGDDRLVYEMFSQCVMPDRMFESFPECFDALEKYAGKSESFFRLYAESLISVRDPARLYGAIEKYGSLQGGFEARGLKGVIELFGAGKIPPDPEKAAKTFEDLAERNPAARDFCMLMLCHIRRSSGDANAAEAFAGKIGGEYGFDTFSDNINDISMLFGSRTADMVKDSLDALRLDGFPPEKKLEYLGLENLSNGDLEKLGRREDAQYELAKRLSRPYDRTSDFKKAFSILKKLHEKRPEDARYLHALWYLARHGLGTPRDDAIAERCLDAIFEGIGDGRDDCLEALCNILDYNFDAPGYIRVGKASTDDAIAERAASLLEKNPEILRDPSRKNKLLTSLGAFYMWDFKDGKKGEKYYLQAMENGDKRDFFELKNYYRHSGQDAKLLEYFERRRRGEMEVRTLEHALIYLRGRGVEKNLQRAFDMLNGEIWDNKYMDVPAAVWLYAMNAKGIGVEKNPEKARELFDKIVKYGSDAWLAAQIVEGGGHYEFPDIPELKTLGARLAKDAAERRDGDINADRVYAELLQKGLGVEKDDKKAIEHFIRFAETRGAREDFWGYGDAVRLYRFSDTARDHGKAFELVKKWTEKSPDSVYAHTLMGVLSLYGCGCTKDGDKAFECFKKAASLPFDPVYSDLAIAGLILCLQDGIGTEKNPEKVSGLLESMYCMEWSKCGSVNVFFDVAMNFKKGADMNADLAFTGFEPDDEKADFWLEVAEIWAKRKNRKSAIRQLAEFYKNDPDFKNPQKAMELESHLKAEAGKAK